jgi:hypothetical protein
MSRSGVAARGSTTQEEYHMKLVKATPKAKKVNFAVMYGAKP